MQGRGRAIVSDKDRAFRWCKVTRQNSSRNLKYLSTRVTSFHETITGDVINNNRL